MVDAADHEKLEAAKNELHQLLEKPQLAGIPVKHSVCFVVLMLLVVVSGSSSG